MTKQHFIAFAREIAASNRSIEERSAAAWIVARVAIEFNPRFDTARFFRACNLPM